MNAPKKYVVGLTGGIGSGKSAVAEVFRSLGVHVVNADDLSREVVEPGQAALKSIAAHFGSDVITADGSLDRAALRTLVFTNPEQKAWLEELLHPLIGELIGIRLGEAESNYAILESPLLLETQQYKLVDRILVVDVSEETQIVRAVKRDGSDADIIRSIIASQLERAERSRRADDVLSNEGSLEALKDKVEALHRKYEELAAE